MIKLSSRFIHPAPFPAGPISYEVLHPAREKEKKSLFKWDEHHCGEHEHLKGGDDDICGYGALYLHAGFLSLCKEF